MIVCPHCNHQNPDEAAHCEHCYAPLPSTTHCPNCNATVQSDASFCGQCGFNLQNTTGGHSHPSPLPPTIAAPAAAPPTRPLPDIDRTPIPPTVAAPGAIPDEFSEVKAPLSPTIATPVAPSTEMPPPDFNIPDLPPLILLFNLIPSLRRCLILWKQWKSMPLNPIFQMQTFPMRK
ncbi:zinc ribbon domain-containing protein [Egbenema bharatensis]|uniref:zinc ribbon domain-containing protein n=1 Tax=Egbenema bharatensis TaxID=3463334 RepID=UPI003A88CF52